MNEESSPNLRRLASESGMADLERILSKFGFDDETLSLLKWHLYEIYKGSTRYIRYYESLFDHPQDPDDEREHVADNLSEVMVLMEDVVGHAKDLTKNYPSSS